MSYTGLRVVEAGVVLYAEHLRRMAAAGPEAAERFRDFATAATPGIYAVEWRDRALQVTLRSSSRYFDGMPVRFAASPVLSSGPKKPPPNEYSPLRVDGFATLLTSSDGREIYEACLAAVIAWDGESLVMPPVDRPRLVSTAEAAVRTALAVREAPIPVASSWPLAALNAIVGVCLLDAPPRLPFPGHEVERLKRVFAGATLRP